MYKDIKKFMQMYNTKYFFPSYIVWQNSNFEIVA